MTKSDRIAQLESEVAMYRLLYQDSQVQIGYLTSMLEKWRHIGLLANRGERFKGIEKEF